MDYLDCISTFFPDVFVECIGDPTIYGNIVFVSGNPLPDKLTLDELIFQQLKTDKITELSKACQANIVNGFTSMALGTLNKYDSEEVDQLNLIGGVTSISPTIEFPSGYTLTYAVRPIVGGIVQSKQYIEHSFTQLRQALMDGASFKHTELLKFNAKRNSVNACLTTESVNLIDWNSVE